MHMQYVQPCMQFSAELSTKIWICRVSNLKYESVRIGSKTVVFIRVNPGKKETTNGLGSHVISFGIGGPFRKW